MYLRDSLIKDDYMKLFERFNFRKTYY